MKTEDEFVRPPRWLLVFWNSNGKIELSVLLDPLEANIAFEELRLPEAKYTSLHRFAPRNRRDQKELLTSGLTSWSGVFISGVHNASNQAMINSELELAVMSVSVFGSSTCYKKIDHDGHSADKLCRFLGLVPPPSLAEAGITSDDWRALINGKWIDSDGFAVGDSNTKVVRPSDVSESCWKILQSVRSSNRWRKSPINAIFALVLIRNMEPWYDRSDLNAVLRKQEALS